jgi:hypothetical protein
MMMNRGRSRPRSGDAATKRARDRIPRSPASEGMFWKKWEDDGRCNLEHRPPTDYDKVGEEGEKFMVIEKKVFLCFLGGLLAVVLASAEPTGKLSPVEELGKKLFFDTNLSSPPGQSCAACHDPKAGWYRKSGRGLRGRGQRTLRKPQAAVLRVRRRQPCIPPQ